jgi:hypothetical protein
MNALPHRQTAGRIPAREYGRAMYRAFDQLLPEPHPDETAVESQSAALHYQIKGRWDRYLFGRAHQTEYQVEKKCPIFPAIMQSSAFNARLYLNIN